MIARSGVKIIKRRFPGVRGNGAQNSPAPVWIGTEFEVRNDTATTTIAITTKNDDDNDKRRANKYRAARCDGLGARAGQCSWKTSAKLKISLR